MKTALIICNGRVIDYSKLKSILPEAQLVVAVDGGCVHAYKMGIEPRIVMGDFDSVDPSLLSHFRSKGVEVIEFSAQKDMTDTQLAVTEVLKRGYDSIVLTAFSGTRIDHTLANIFLLRMIKDAGKTCMAIDEKNTLTIICEKTTFVNKKGYFLSIIPMTDVKGVTTKGLKYPLENSELDYGATIGVSNEFIEDTATIDVMAGELLVFISQD